MANNKFLIFDETGDNMFSAAEYSGNQQRISGVTGGVANSKLENTMAHEVTTMTYAFGQALAQRGYDADPSNIPGLVEAIVQCFTLDKATTAQAQSGTDDTTYMTPAKTNSFYTAHKASAAEVLAGTNDTKFLTPKTASQGVAAALPKQQELFVADHTKLGYPMAASPTHIYYSEGYLRSIATPTSTKAFGEEKAYVGYGNGKWYSCKIIRDNGENGIIRITVSKTSGTSNTWTVVLPETETQSSYSAPSFRDVLYNHNTQRIVFAFRFSVYSSSNPDRDYYLLVSIDTMNDAVLWHVGGGSKTDYGLANFRMGISGSDVNSFFFEYKGETYKITDNGTTLGTTAATYIVPNNCIFDKERIIAQNSRIGLVSHIAYDTLAFYSLQEKKMLTYNVYNRWVYQSSSVRHANRGGVLTDDGCLYFPPYDDNGITYKLQLI